MSEMSSWINEVVQINKIEPHPNADTLSIASVLNNIEVVIKTGAFKVGDLAFYISIDTIVPDNETFHFLAPLEKLSPVDKALNKEPAKLPVGSVPEKYRIIKSKKIRNVYSEGMLIPYEGTFALGDDITSYLKLTKRLHEEEIEEFESNKKTVGPEKGPKTFSISKYGLDAYAKYGYLFQEGDQVLVHEKLEGENISFTYAEDRLWVKSRTQWKANKEQKFSRNFFKKMWIKISSFFQKPVDLKKSHSHWWDYAIRCNVAEKLKDYAYLSFFGEYYGNVKGFKYDCEVSSDKKIQREVRIFDIYDIKAKKFLEWDLVEELCAKVGFKTAPLLYKGPLPRDVVNLAEGNSSIGDHIKEGIVIRAFPERRHEKIGRMIMKHKGKGYKLFKQ